MRFHVHSLARPKRVAKALRKELASAGIAASLPACQDNVAEMYGYAHWHEMAADIGRHTPSVEDAKLNAVLIVARRSQHIEALVKRFSELASRRSLAEKIVAAITPTGAFVDSTSSAMIRAECHMSDFSAAIKFDALPWFETASDDELVEWLDDQLAGFSYKSGDISWKLRNMPGYDHLKIYEERAEEMSQKQDLLRDAEGEIVTSIVRVHIPDALRWIRKHRPELVEEILDIAKAYKETANADYTPEWEADPRWPGQYGTLAPGARRRHDQIIHDVARPKRAPKEFKEFLFREWDRNLVRFSVVPHGDGHLIIRDWMGVREAAPLDANDLPAVEAAIESYGLHFQQDEATEWFGGRRSRAQVTRREGGLFVDFSRGALKPQTLENLGVPNCEALDRVMASRRRGLIVVVGQPGSGKTTRLQALALGWLERLPHPRRSQASLAAALSAGALPVDGYGLTVFPDLRDANSIEAALAAAQDRPVVATMHSGSEGEAFGRLLKLSELKMERSTAIDLISNVLVGVMTVRTVRPPSTEIDRLARRSSPAIIHSDYVTFASSEEVEAFVAQHCRQDVRPRM